MRRFVYGLCLLLGAAVFTTAPGEGGTEPAAADEAWLFRGGQRVQPGRSRQVVEECVRLLTQADGTKRLIMSAQRLERLRQEATVVECRLTPPRQLKIPVREQTVPVSRIMVPLTGDFTGLVFYGTPDYGAGSFVTNSAGVDGLRKLVEES